MSETKSKSDKIESVFDGVPIHSSTVNKESFVESEVVETYSVSENADVTILKDPGREEYFYRVDEPELDEFERLIKEEVSSKLVTALKYEERDGSTSEMETVIRENARSIMNNYIRPGSKFWQKIRKKIPYVDESRILTEDSVERILYYIIRDFVYYGRLTPLMMDSNIEDISVDKPNHPVFIYHEDYSDMEASVAYESNEMKSFIRTLAKEIGKSVSIANPEVSGSLDDGSRVELVFSDEITGDGSNITIRKFQDIPFTPVDLVDFGTFSLEQMAYLWLAIENNMSLIFAGGTASGKTTSMNAVSLFIPPKKKTITIEDTREIQLRHNNWIKSVTRDSFGGSGVGEVNMYELLRYALRQRPEYIIVGEIRGEEAQTLFQAMSTGHTTYSTMHADSVESAIHRLENRPIEVPRPMLKSLDILCIQNLTYMNDEKLRRNEVLSEIIGIDSETRQIRTQNAFEWDRRDDTHSMQDESHILNEIKKKRTWSDRELSIQMNLRKLVLKFLVENNIRDYRVVTDVIRSFILNEENVVQALLSGELQPITNATEPAKEAEQKISELNPTTTDDSNPVSLREIAEAADIEVGDSEGTTQAASDGIEKSVNPQTQSTSPDSIDPDVAKKEVSSGESDTDEYDTSKTETDTDEFTETDDASELNSGRSNKGEKGVNSSEVDLSGVENIDSSTDMSKIISSKNDKEQEENDDSNGGEQ